MKKWFTFIFSFFSFLAVALMILILVLGNKPYAEAKQQAIDRTKDEGVLVSAERSYVYSDENPSVTVIGIDTDGGLRAVFVPTDDSEMSHMTLTGKITAQEARDIALKEMEVKEILHTKLGIENGVPVWEVSFLTENERLNYVYVTAVEGTVSKRILNL